MQPKELIPDAPLQLSEVKIEHDTAASLSHDTLFVESSESFEVDTLYIYSTPEKKLNRPSDFDLGRIETLTRINDTIPFPNPVMGMGSNHYPLLEQRIVGKNAFGTMTIDLYFPSLSRINNNLVI